MKEQNMRDALIELTEKLSSLGMSQDEIFELLERFLFQETSRYLKAYEEAADEEGVEPEDVFGFRMSKLKNDRKQ